MKKTKAKKCSNCKKQPARWAGRCMDCFDKRG